MRFAEEKAAALLPWCWHFIYRGVAMSTPKRPPFTLVLLLLSPLPLPPLLSLPLSRPLFSSSFTFLPVFVSHPHAFVSVFHFRPGASIVCHVYARVCCSCRYCQHEVAASWRAGAQAAGALGAYKEVALTRMSTNESISVVCTVLPLRFLQMA